MSSSDIQAKVKAGLAKAVNAVGSSSDLPIYLVKTTQSGNPLSPSITEIQTLLVNAIFKSYDQGLNDISIKSGDRQLISNSDVPVQQNDKIKQGDNEYIVVSVDEVSPTGSPLVYISQTRLQ